ncbi:zinc finger protein 583-like isoform X2 [Amphiprion ocellaris]|uniref:zinc finger protein 583-like isoform X2 n=1 Tax=Amphiprion ocellaris TaxID=80972 RepID=UPI002411512E|nr:zinc finger protein 583-like isoform X2 [Amphiprion ocellaris]
MSNTVTDHGCLPLSSLRLLVPPVQLLSAALWQIVKQGAVEYYGLLEEFISTVLETVPELLTDTEAVQLVVGLHAKVVLELCCSDDFARPENIQPHLSRINTYITKQDKETSSFAVKASMTNFLKLVHTLVDDQHQRDIFYQKIFPTVFGDKYDSALQTLMRKFLFNLQKLLPVPSLEQTSLWLSLSPPVLKECVDFVSQPEHLTTLIQHHKNHGHEVPQALPSAGDDCILSSLSYHLAKMDNDEGNTAVKSGSDWHRENSLGSVSEEDREENFEEMDSEVAMIEERNGQQHTDDLTEHEGASVECGKEFDSCEDWETHQEGECRNHHPHVEREYTQENHKNSALSRAPAQIQTVIDVTADSQVCKSPLTCQECGQAFAYYKSFEKHQSKCCKRAPQRKKRTNSNHFIISACNFQSADTSSETVESETVAPQNSANCADGSLNTSRIIKCTMCEKNFSDIVLMRRHYSKSHKVRGPYPCPLCKRTFVRLCELVRHQQNKKLYQCAACKKCYAKPGALNDHEKVHTTSATPHVCETCGKSFRSLPYLILHQRKHRERQPRERQPSVCSYCGKQFGTKVCLKAHMVRHTGGYPCQLCGKKFYQKTYLKWHLNKHAGQEPYLCDTCGKGWPSAAQLERHMVQHTEERPFKCEDCGATYKRGSHLMAHRRAKHIRLRPFVCDVCSRAFRLNSELNRHMMIHTGERPFACLRCRKTFTRKSHLREHREKACL